MPLFFYPVVDIQEYSNMIGIPVDTLISKHKSRSSKYRLCRQIYWLYLYSNQVSGYKIASMFNRHQSVIYRGIETARNLIRTKDNFTLQQPYFEFIQSHNLLN